MFKRFIAAAALLLIIPFFAFAQDGAPVAVLEYFDNPDGIQVISAEGQDVFPEYGMELIPGDKIKTTQSVAELRLDPNGSVIKLSTNTEFGVESLQNRDNSDSNTFSLVTGKLRAIAARSGNEKYEINTQTAVCGVRGTIFGIGVDPGNSEAALVEKGSVTFTKKATGQVVELGAGMLADTFAETFQAIEVSAERMSEFFQGIEEFEAETINPDEVPGNESEEVAEAETAEEEVVEDDTTATEAPEEEGETVTEEVTPEEAAEEGLFEPIMDWAREALGMEIGTITIDNRTYSKAVLQPEFDLGKLKMGLYLPIIYETNMFDPDDWYRPRGNDEWSFGTDIGWSDNPLDAAKDAAGDLFLKIRYMQIGEQRDKFYLKVGNLDNMTIGHGILMRNYANDSDFPSIRRIGVNTGFDFGVIGLEAVANDLAEPEIFGGRFYLRPFGTAFKLAIGASGIVDIDPAGELPATSDTYGDPIFINAALDLDLPIVEADFLSIVLFGDVAGMVPYFRETYTDPDTGAAISQAGFYLDALILDDPAAGEFPLRNYGMAAGVFGNIFVLDYRLEYRNYNGTFRPTFYGPNYDRLRGTYVEDVFNDAVDPPDIGSTVGIYGEAGFAIGDKFTLDIGYLWPFIPGGEDGTGGFFGTPTDDDQFTVEAVLEKGLIPVLDMHGSFTYNRTKFIPTLIEDPPDEDTTVMALLFDGNTTMSGELIYPVAETLDVAILVSTNIQREEDGSVIYDDNGIPKVNPSLSIETRVHF